MSKEQPAPQVRLMRMPEVLRLVGVSRASFWDGIRAGRYPQPRKLGACAVWVSTEIEELVQRVVAGDKSLINPIDRPEMMRAARAIRTAKQRAKAEAREAAAPSDAAAS